MLAEFCRVLAPCGHLLMAFQAIDDLRERAQAFDHKVALAYRWSPDHIAGLLREAGLGEVGRLLCEPAEGNGSCRLACRRVGWREAGWWGVGAVGGVAGQ